MATVSQSSVTALMRWYLDAGVDETVGEEPVNRFAIPAAADPAPTAAPVSGEPDTASAPPPRRGATGAPTAPDPDAATAGQPRQWDAAAGQGNDAAGPSRRSVQQPTAPLGEAASVRHAVALAAEAADLASLREALAGFDGCPLKRTATNLVFGRGSPAARIVFIGEAPGAEEDLKGSPFVGPSGRLLDRILASIGLGEESVFISNTVFWRPPGNRSPTSSELAACMPFLQRMLELIDPVVLVALGGPAATTLLGRTESVSKMRGRWFDYQTPGLPRPVTTAVTFHPAYLLRSPLQKRLAWRDFLAIKHKLADEGVVPKQQAAEAAH